MSFPDAVVVIRCDDNKLEMNTIDLQIDSGLEGHELSTETILDSSVSSIIHEIIETDYRLEHSQ